MKRVLVTGANGFVGRRVCVRLIEEGISVVGSVRQAESIRDLPRSVVPFVSGDLTKMPSWNDVLRDVDVVIHLVAQTHVMSDRAADPLTAYRELNVEGTRRLLACCQDSGISRFVFLSSIKSVGEGSNSAYSESTICAPEDAYGISKREAERCIEETARNSEIAATIIRSPLVYGPRVRGNFLRLMNLVDRQVPLPFAWVRNSRSIVFVDNLADAIVTALQHPAAKNETLHVADEHPISTPQLIEQIASAMQRQSRVMRCPIRLLNWMAKISGQSDRMRRLIGSLTVSNDKIERMLDWHPPVGFEDGIQQTVDWHQSTMSTTRYVKETGVRKQAA